MSIRLPSAIGDFVRVWGLLVLLVLAGFVITYQYVGTPPPTVVRIATGMEDGAYYAFARQYARLLADDGVTLEVVPTAGSVENLRLLREGVVSLALVQGGCATDGDRRELQALGSLFLEPVWIFTRASAPIERLGDLAGTRVAVGADGSGTYRLATQLLATNGVADSDAAFVRADSAEAVRLLTAGEIDAAIFVASVESPVIRALLERRDVVLIDLERTTAYARVFPFLAPVTLSEGVVDLARNIPSADTRMVAASASLAARGDLHPALIPALLNAVTRVHEPGGVLETPGEFPSASFGELPMNEDARRYIDNGPTFLYRWVPYGTAVLLDRLKILVLPLVALLLPLFRVGPPLYQWRIRSRIYRWYAEVRDIDLTLLSEGQRDAGAIEKRLAVLEREVASVAVPLAYAGEQYHLRLHIRLLQERLGRVRQQE